MKQLFMTVVTIIITMIINKNCETIKQNNHNFGSYIIQKISNNDINTNHDTIITNSKFYIRAAVNISIFVCFIV